MSKAVRNPEKLKRQIQTKLDKLQKLSPTQIKDRIAGHRRGYTHASDQLANWLSEQLEVERITVKPIQNVIENLEITVEAGELRYVYKFLVKTSLQDFLGIKKKQDQVTGLSLSPEQSILIRALIDREGGNESELLKQLLNSAFADSPAINEFVARVKAHPEWHEGMHEAGLYPADIFSASKKVRKAAKQK